MVGTAVVDDDDQIMCITSAGCSSACRWRTSGAPAAAPGCEGGIARRGRARLRGGQVVRGPVARRVSVDARRAATACVLRTPNRLLRVVTPNGKPSSTRQGEGQHTLDLGGLPTVELIQGETPEALRGLRRRFDVLIPTHHTLQTQVLLRAALAEGPNRDFGEWDAVESADYGWLETVLRLLQPDAALLIFSPFERVATTKPRSRRLAAPIGRRLSGTRPMV